MKKGMEPPPEYPVEILPPPYPGPPLNHNMSAQLAPQPVAEPAPQSYPQPVAQPAPQSYPQPVAQPAPQSYPQPAPQSYHQPVAQPAPQYFIQPVVQPVSKVFAVPVQPQVIQYTTQQPQVVHTVCQVVTAQQPPRDVSGHMRCPHCQTPVVTRVGHKIGMLTWVIFLVLLLIGCWPFCLIPFCVESCLDVEHSCPSCYNVIHVYKRM